MESSQERKQSRNQGFTVGLVISKKERKVVCLEVLNAVVRPFNVRHRSIRAQRWMQQIKRPTLQRREKVKSSYLRAQPGKQSQHYLRMSLSVIDPSGNPF